MKWLNKSVNLTNLDLILVAVVGGLILLGATLLINLIYKYCSKKYSKKIKKISRSFKYINEVSKRKKLFKLDYDKALYNLVSNDAFFRILFPSERKYLKKYKEIHEEQKRRTKTFFKENVHMNNTPWK